MYLLIIKVIKALNNISQLRNELTTPTFDRRIL